MQKSHYLLSFVLSAIIISGGFFGLVSSNPSVPDENPYREETLVVSMTGSNADFNQTEVAQDSLNYWSENSAQYAGYPIDYDLNPNASDPNVEIVWVDSLDSCDEYSDPEIAGCADLVQGGLAPSTVTVRIETGHDRSVTEEVLKHELGHTLGLTHDDEPADIMSEN